MTPRTLQEWLQVPDRRWVLWAACLLGILVVSLVYSYKRFHGPAEEITVTRLELGRSLAEGRGFTTRIHYPQTLAVAKSLGWAFDANTNVPSLDQPPLYSTLVGAALAVVPSGVRARWFSEVPNPPQGTYPDYLVLGLNVVLLWVGLWLTYTLGVRWFGANVGRLALVAVFLSVPVWSSVISLDGGALTLVLWLCWLWFLERHLEAPTWKTGAFLGALAGLLFLADYAAVALVPLLVVLTWVRLPPARRRAPLLVSLGLFLAVSAPWMYRNVHYTGSPLGLASQGIAAKAGDSTAEPAVLRQRLEAGGYTFDLDKWGNKVLSTLRDDAMERYWMCGLGFAALFAVGWLYPYAEKRLDDLRLWGTLSATVYLVAAAAIGSGEDPRNPLVTLTPFFCLFGAGFLMVLLESLNYSDAKRAFAFSILLGFQGIAVGRGLMEPRRIHFSYPPYYPKLFVAVSRELELRRLNGWSWLCDVPAGAAWYGGSQVWAQPSTLREFYLLGAQQPVAALVLTPFTLSRPYFSSLAAGEDEWQSVYRGLATGRMPREFPLAHVESFAPDLLVLVDGRAADSSHRP